MTAIWQYGKVTFECDDCGETLDTDERDFLTAVDTMKAEGWWAIPPNYEDDNTEWSHQCADCKPKRRGQR